MRYDNDDRGGRRGHGRFEPAEDGERRRWHGDDGEHHGGYSRGRGRGRHFGGPFGPGFPGGPGFGPGFGGPDVAALRAAMGGWGPEPRHMRGPRAKRGDVRAAALALLTEQPLNGYQIIQEISERSGAVWRPSPGSVYPALQQLEDEGLIRADTGDSGRRAYQLTDEGRQYAASHADELRAPWDDVAGHAAAPAIELRRLIGQVAMAASQVISAGTDAQGAQARQVLVDARKALYRILATDEDEAGPAASSAAGDGE
jgi:DNA-binding PadR family transcriptional regulator